MPSCDHKSWNRYLSGRIPGGVKISMDRLPGCKLRSKEAVWYPWADLRGDNIYWQELTRHMLKGTRPSLGVHMPSHSQYTCFHKRGRELDSCGFAMLSCTILPQQANLAGVPSLRSLCFSTEQVHKLVARFCRWKVGRPGDCQQNSHQDLTREPSLEFQAASE